VEFGSDLARPFDHEVDDLKDMGVDELALTTSAGHPRPAPRERVLPIFRRELRSAAVFQAFLEVEERVRAMSLIS
jgi:hypothetical protein